MKIAVYPQAEQLTALTRGPADTPVVMVNLLRFKQRADGADDLSGEDAYQCYAERMRGIVEAAGGRLLWAGRVDGFVIGESDVPFDVVALVEYPSRAVFLQLVASPEVQALGEWRARGLDGQWLIATTTRVDPS